MKINLPNQITLARLVMAVVFLICLAQFEIRDPEPKLRLLDVCGVLFIIAGLSDILDGYLARKHNEVTSFGRVIDPFVDKILVLGAYAFLAGDGFVTPEGDKVSDVSIWMVVVILGRELLVTSLRGVTEATGQSFAANVYGKLKMALQSITVGWVLFTVAHPGMYWLLIAMRPILVYATVGITILSMFPYLWMARGVLTQMSVATK